MALLFQPLAIKKVLLRNRIVVSPMCADVPWPVQYEGAKLR